MQRIDKKIEDSLKKIELIYNIITEKFFGQKKIVEQVLVSILSSGNTLIVGVPGLGKTLLFKTLSESLKLESRRIQCTPDLMPFDIIGTEILSSKDIKKFSFIRFAGEDYKLKDLIIKKGEIIQPKHIMALTTLGINYIKVMKKPKITVQEHNLLFYRQCKKDLLRLMVKILNYLNLL